ncbi:MAG: methyltransferase domain-containing protein [Acidimicrobiales bacterium]
MVGETGNESRFEPGVEAWIAGLGKARDAVRQHLVQRQLAVHLSGRPAPLAVLDIGCGQGTQAVGLARAGHIVVGLDVSAGLLEQARSLQQAEPADVRGRLRFEHGDLLHLDGRHQGRYDLVCCHGVAMYLPSLAETAAALVGATRRPGGLVSILTRNRAGIAMRAGMRRDWTAALAGFDARYYTNRLGLESIRADEPAEVQAALAEAGATTIAWYGVRLFSDHWDAEEPPADLDVLLEAEEQAGRRDPYRALAALTHTVAELA